MLLVVMGVSGSGKTRLGKALAERRDGCFLDADDLHPPANVAKMRAGHALSDADRAPWLAAICDRLRTYQSEGRPAVIACSALKRSYRDQFREAAPGLRLLYLQADREETERRLHERRGHFMSAALLDSQFDTLEVPSEDEHPIVVEASLPFEREVSLALQRIELAAASGSEGSSQA